MAHLVFQTAFPGDLFLSIPLIKRLRVWDPGSHLVLACRPGLGDFFLRNKLVDEVIEIDKRSKIGRKEALRRLRLEDWGVVLVPHQSVRTALWMRGVRGQKVSFRSWWNRPFYQHRVEKPMHLPDALRQLSLLAPIDGRVAELFASEDVAALRNPDSLATIDLQATPIPEWASMQVRPHQTSGKTVFLAPGSVWGTKRWTAASYEKLASYLLVRGFDVVLVGSRDERELCAQIAAKVSGVRNRAGQTSLADLVEEFSRGTILVCNDSGAMHAAAAAGLPTVAVFGPTTLHLGFRPWNSRAIVVQKELPCRPCGAHGPQVCPLGTHECMRSVSAEVVLAAVESILSAGDAR